MTLNIFLSVCLKGTKGKKARKSKEQSSPTTNTTGAIAVDIEIKREERPSVSFDKKNVV